MKHFSRITRNSVLASIAAVALLGAATDEAQAHGRVFVGGGVIVGRPYYAYPPYYGYPYYDYPPTYYSQPYYAPPPRPVYGYYAPPPPAPTDHYYNDNDDRYCREYTHRIIIDGRPREAYGHACRQPDGSWQIID